MSCIQYNIQMVLERDQRVCGMRTKWAKKWHPFFIATTLSTVYQLSYFWFIIHYRKFAAGRCIVRLPSTIFVSTPPCKNLITILLMVWHCIAYIVLMCH